MAKKRKDRMGNEIPTVEEQIMQEAKDAADRKLWEKLYNEQEKSTPPAPLKRAKGGMIKEGKERYSSRSSMMKHEKKETSSMERKEDAAKKCSGGVMKKASGGMAKKSSSSSVMPRGMGLMKKQKACKMY